MFCNFFFIKVLLTTETHASNITEDNLYKLMHHQAHPLINLRGCAGLQLSFALGRSGRPAGPGCPQHTKPYPPTRAFALKIPRVSYNSFRIHCTIMRGWSFSIGEDLWVDHAPISGEDGKRSVSEESWAYHQETESRKEYIITLLTTVYF